MEIILPCKLNSVEPITVNDENVLVVIGANGTGKSSFGRDIAERYPDFVERIAAMRALFISTSSVNFRDMISERLLSPLVSDYERLVLRLREEEYEAAVNYKEACKENPSLLPPVTKIDKIQEIWEKMFPYNRLVRKSGFIELAATSKNGSSYNASRMSDGEKIVFYLIGAVLNAKPNALLVIEEPEIHLHTSIKGSLWDEIEMCRPDCTFIYLTHDIEFASSRRHSKRIWIRSYDGDEKTWDYEIMEDNESFPEELYLEILGSRKPVLFIEGTDQSSIDIRLYPHIFPEYMVKPMGGCQKVIETTKAFGQLKDFHLLESKGIVDRDRRTEGEIEYLRQQNILVPDVAEVENLLMLEDVIKTVAKRLMRNSDSVFRQVKENVVKLFVKEMESQVILHAKHQVRKKLETTVDRKIATVEQLAEHVEMIRNNIHVHEIYKEIKNRFASYASQGDYQSILRVYNQKGMLPQSRLCNLLGINNKESYLKLILSILKEDKKDAQAIRMAIKKSLGA
ncbi:DUF4435 domain-containing protein [Parabacteroides pacaensis]|uniref:DUF4435 domain-containing protein n=1 Tax=Parabacteroides pacaensis TaxID=2086575 RepID=UPI000D0F6098|nr:DUF4435 domain-containing protein [Parabacteroides pacaensis]